MNVGFFHGLESPKYSEKNEFLEKKFDYVYAPPMDYAHPTIFQDIVDHLKKNKVDVLIGSSMGGWFSYALSSVTGIPTLLFNPATQKRSVDPKIYLGKKSSFNRVIFGLKDDIVDFNETKKWFNINGIGKFDFIEEKDMGHRIPLEIFEKHVNEIIRLKTKIKTYREWDSIKEF